MHTYFPLSLVANLSSSDAVAILEVLQLEVNQLEQPIRSRWITVGIREYPLVPPLGPE